MSVNLSRSRIVNGLAIVLSATAMVMLAYVALPLLAGSRPETPILGEPRVKPVGESATMRRSTDGQSDAGSSQRIQRMEAELQALQEEAAKNPSRPTVAEMEHELNRMVAERHGNSEIPHLERLVKWSVGLTILLAMALLGLALGQLRETKNAPSEI